MEARTEFEQFILDVSAVIVGASDPNALERVLDLVRRRETKLRDQCRAALNAERTYQNTLHQRVGSRYGAERRERELAAARDRREHTAKELGL